jgi:hypothetical protein
MPPLSARNVEDARAGGGAEDVDEPRDFVAIALEGEERLVLEQVLGVEVVRPPVSGIRRRLAGFIRNRNAARCS